MTYNRSRRKPSKAYRAGITSAAIGIGCLGIILILALSILFSAGVAALLAFPLWFIWNNAIVPNVSGLSEIPYVLAFGVTFILVFIANIFSRGGSK